MRAKFYPFPHRSDAIVPSLLQYLCNLKKEAAVKLPEDIQ